MRFQYLGTAAAEGWPGVFCRCAVCEEARALGGRHIRTRSQAMINDDLLLDFPGDTYMHALHYGLDLAKIQYLFVTHCHIDHFYPQEFILRGDGFSSSVSNSPLSIFCSADTRDFFDTVAAPYMSPSCAGLLQWHILEPYVPVQAGPYTVTPLPANHMHERPTAQPFLYQIENGSQSLLYCHDTGRFHEEVWTYLSTVKKPFSMISFDCTFGNCAKGQNNGHMGLGDVQVLRSRLQEMGLCTADTLCVLNHFSHNGISCLYHDLCAIAEPMGYLVSYDGMEFDL